MKFHNSIADNSESQGIAKRKGSRNRLHEKRKKIMDQYRIRMENKLPEPGAVHGAYRACYSNLSQAMAKAVEMADKAVRSGKYKERMFAVFVDWTKENDWVQPGIYGLCGGAQMQESDDAYMEFVSVSPVTLNNGTMVPEMVQNMKNKYVVSLHHTPEHTLLCSGSTLSGLLNKHLSTMVPSRDDDSNRPWVIQVSKAMEDGSLKAVCQASGRGYGPYLQLENWTAAEDIDPADQEELAAYMQTVPAVETAEK